VINSTMADVTALKLPARTFRPRRYRPGNRGAWSGHLPFAHDLIAVLRPSLLVELGTHLGESYFGMCQSVEENGVSCKCYAVDTWQGDPQAGFYDESVFTEVDAYNRQNYSSFSKLLRSSFDAARDSFADQTIDLLHIDGLHTYEAVRHDFDTWWPKVRPGGVVLFHDTAARHDDFGVWKLWEELSRQFPHFEFTHWWGLGVLQKPGGSASNERQHPVLSASPAEQDFLRHYYDSQAHLLEYLCLGASSARAQTFRVFPCVDGGYREETSVATGLRNGQWHHVRLELPQGTGDGPLRVDPADSVCVIQFAGAQLLRAADGAVLRSWTSEDIRQWRPAGDLVLLPGDEPTRLLSTGHDPQLLLPAMDSRVSDQPLIFEARIRVEEGLSAIVPVLSGARGPGQSDEFEARLAAAVAERDASNLRAEQLSAEVRHLQAAQFTVAADYRRVHALNDALQTELTMLKGRLESERQGWESERQRTLDEAEALRAELRVTLGSRSWRLTAPLRALLRALR
jgi:hypothetical protein